MGNSGIGHHDAPETFLITGAAPGLDEQHRARVRKYLTLMAFRVPALFAAGIAYSLTQNGWIALAIVAASIPLPWIAVLVANDRPPRKRGEVAHYLHGDHPAADGDIRALDAGFGANGRTAVDGEITDERRPPSAESS